ncbi:MAG: TIGR04255 family protein [Flavobacterium sp.]|nr:TIGR04255 family protein [Flavobacterium sp.]
MNYKNAPIQEAIFDIKIDKLNTNQVQSLNAIKDKIDSNFVVEKKRNNFLGTIEFKEEQEPASKIETNDVGFIYSTLDTKQQLQVRLDGFTLNVLKPYSTWKKHYETFKKNWDIYSNTFNPNLILKISTRFINKIEIPMPFASFQAYFTNIPPIPTCLPQSFSNFFMQTQIPYNDDLKMVTITETIAQKNDETLNFILDIDVSQELGIINNDENINKIFAEMRVIKNEVFESCITNKTRELFN